MKHPRQPSEMNEIIRRLRQAYGNAECALDHKNPFELLAATILSAQCTDKRVNMVTPALFKRYPTPAAMAAADLADVEDLVRTTGFFRNKAKSLVGMAQALETHHMGTVPRTLEELIALPGVARKTVNVVLGVAYGLAVGIVVDTHVGRLSRRLGLTTQTDPVKVERELMALVPHADWISFSHMLIHHGREVCDARSPACDRCSLAELCPSSFSLAPAPSASRPSRKSTSKALARKTSGTSKSKKKR